jgi:nucleoside-diphosphate-sugar epimerase
MRMTVFGANGPTGRRTVARALRDGWEVAAAVRDPAAFPLTDARLAVVRTDVDDPASVASAVAGSDAIVSSLGVPFSRQPITIYSRGIAAILAAAPADVRLVAVSSSAVEPHPEPSNGWLFERVLQPWIVDGLGRTTYADLRAMEALLAQSRARWSVVRASGLFDGEGVTGYASGHRHLPGRYTSRTDLADLLVRIAGGDEHLREWVEIRTTEGTPDLLTFLRTEAFKK